MPELEVRGFRGGITDDRDSQNLDDCYEADNFVIDHPSGDLVERGGSLILNETTPRPTEQRIATLINQGPDEKLFLVSEGKLFKDDGDDGIAQVTGPRGGAFSGLSADAIASHCEYNEHLYIATDDGDGDGVKPVKIYKDSDSSYQLRTAGLPKLEGDDSFTEVTSAMISLANDLRSKFIAHYANTTTHPVAADSVSSALITLSALSAGATLAECIALIKELKLAYKSHYKDAVLPTGDRSYHSNSLGDNPGVPNIPLTNVADPVTYYDCAVQLNELKEKYDWHVRAFKGHPSVDNETTAAFVFLSAIPSRAADGSDAPFLVPSDSGLTPLYDLANEIKAMFNEHIADATSTTAGHREADTENTISIDDANSLRSLKELTMQLYQAYKDHQADVQPVYRNLQGATNHTTTNQITSIAQITGAIKGSINDLEVGMYVIYDGSSFPINAFPTGTKISEISGTTLTLDDDHTSAGANPETVQYAFTLSRYHAITYDAETSLDSANLNDASFSAMAEDLAVLTAVLNDIREKYNYHDASGSSTVGGGTQKIHSFGENHQVNENEEITKSVKSYIYAFCYKYEYTTSTGKTFIDRSSPILRTVKIFDDPELAPIVVSTLPELENASNENYDVDNIKIEIYRTQDGSTILRKVGEVDNGTTTFTDNLSDEQLASREALYTTGGVVDFDPPPIAKVIHEHNGFGYYGNLKVGTEYYPNRIAQSIGGEIDSVPESFFVDLPHKVVGISSTKRAVVAWTPIGTYRLEGTFDERGQGVIIAVPVSGKIGLRGALSPVQIDDGIVFAGNDGFYFTDGYKLVPLSSKRFPATYQSLVQNASVYRKIQGTYDPINQLVYWACSLDGVKNDTLFVLHLKFGIREDGASFTTWSGENNFQPSAVAMFNGSLIRGDERGYVFKHNEDYSDPFVETDKDASEWGEAAIKYDYQSPDWDFGTKKIKKYVTKIVGFFEHVGKATIQILRSNDHGKTAKECKKIEFSGRPLGAIMEKRWFPAGNLRCMTMQVRITNQDEGETDEKTRISGYTLQFRPLGDSVSDAGDDSVEVASA